MSRQPVRVCENSHSARIRFLPVLVLLVVLAGMVCGAGAAPTTSVRVAKVATDGVTVINETTVDVPWMESHLPVQGDGRTHYYHQGPVFVDDKEGQWDANETTNFKDRGAVKGTDIRDLVGLVGGMMPDDALVISAVDGYRVDFPYRNIYEPQARQGPLVLCWYNGEETPVGERQGVGYPPAYHTGMRLVFFADTSTNKEEEHVFGNNDMRGVMPEEKIYLFDNLYPSTSGYTVKWVNEITIYSGGFSSNTTGPAKSAIMVPAKTTAMPAKTPLPAFLPLTASCVIYFLDAWRRQKCARG
ncbi:MAG: argininosuccinate synthase [Methanoregula sp.]|nr:argininosuccinate synthase [Methanoregula sp.]